MAIELLFLLLLAYLLLGPRKSAEMARKAGELMAQFNRVKTDFQSKLKQEFDNFESHDGMDQKP